MTQDLKPHQIVAETILSQLGGWRFQVMTGMKLRLAHEPEEGTRGALSFHLPSRGSKDGINYVKITLTGADTYTMEFMKIGPRPSFKQTMAGREQKITLVATKTDIYNDQLESVFASVTGLATRL
jgi:hypothetical protein